MPDSYEKNDEKHGVSDTARPTLTDAEREAIEWCVFQQATPQRVAVTLRRLLERMK